MAGTLDAKVWTSNNGAAGWGDDGKLYQTLDVTAASNEVGGTGWVEVGANSSQVSSNTAAIADLIARVSALESGGA